MDTKRISKLSMLLALSLVLSLVESYIPILNGIIPGFKVGFANIVVLFALYNLSFREAISLSILRVLQLYVIILKRQIYYLLICLCYQLIRV